MKSPARTSAVAWLVLATVGMTHAAPGQSAAPAKKLKIVIFGGHPDDPESGAGGLVALLTRQGHEVILAYGTDFRGDRRFFDRPEADVRREEATAACKVLGATPKFFPYAHEKLVADEPTLKAVASWFDEVKPDIVVTHWPLDTHPNHHVVSSLVCQTYKRKGGWNLYFFEVMTDQQTIAFRPELYLNIGPVREVKKRSLDEQRARGRRKSGRSMRRCTAAGGPSVGWSSPRRTPWSKPRRVARCSRSGSWRRPGSSGRRGRGGHRRRGLTR